MNYDKLKALLANKDDVDRIIKVLTSQGKEVDIDSLKKEYDPTQHPVTQKSIRPDRKISTEDGGEKTEDVTRIAFPMQENIVKKASSFIFGNDVDLICKTKNEKEIMVLDAIKRLNEDASIDSLNLTIADYLFKSTQVAEIWYSELTDEVHETYGFPTFIKLRVSVFSPWDYNELYPYFDERGDLIAFSRRYKFKDDNEKEITHFEIFTKESYDLLEHNPNDRGVNKWENIRSSVNPIKKIQVVYAFQDKAEWENVNTSIERLEFLLSNFGDTNDYNGAPILFGTGQINTFPGKVTTGKVIQGAPGADMKYLSWANAPESIKLEIETHFRIIHTYTQTPDVSFENIKGIGAISGVALKLFFMDAHLKVRDKRKIFDPYLRRRINIQKEFIIAMKLDLKDAARNMNIKAIIKPYMIDDIAERIAYLTQATGGKASLSAKTATSLTGLVEDSDAEHTQILEEEKQRSLNDVLEPSF